MRFKKHITFAIALLALLCVSGSRPAHSQESAIDRIKARLNKPASISPSEAKAAADDAAAAADANRARTEAAVKAAEAGEDPGMAISDGADGVILDSETSTIGEEEDDTESDPDLPSVAGMEFGSESEETGVKDIFTDASLKDELYENAFIYQSAGIPDPMVFPQIRNDTIFSELWAKHENILKEAGIRDPKALKQGDRSNLDLDLAKIGEALEVLARIKEMNDPRFDEQLNAQIKLVTALTTSVPVGPHDGGTTPTQPVGTAPCPLPDQLRSQLSFVIATGDENAYCLIGDYMVRAGETVPEFDEVRVISIAPGKVIFEINAAGCIPSTEEVNISPTLDEGFFGKDSISGKSLLGLGKKGGSGGGKKK